jgi:hypothetical protein
MQLWTEYEGRTIDGAFPLTKLLRPEGRSAFFSTSNGTGLPTVIRLIESHFDEEEILARWRGVAALDHPNIVRLDDYGQVVLDDTSLVYAVMEPVDANLAEVVSGQRLTVPETHQIATSLLSALEVLHSHGFVHEHVEPTNVLAVGEVVKLRSDCIREAPEGEAGQALKRRDIHDLSLVLLQALTQEKTLEAAKHDLPLPAPFDQIIRKGMSGEWGAEEIAGALKLPSTAPPVASDVMSSPKAATAARVISSSLDASVDEVIPSANRLPQDSGERRAGPGPKLKAVIALVLILALWLGWHFLHGPGANRPPAAQVPPTPVAPVAGSSQTQPATASDPSPTAGVPLSQKSNMTGARTQWRVIAYTYNHEGQAQQKSATIAQRHPDLRPEVFSPTGHEPYLVTIGGAMNRNEAFALASKARGEGLPGDTYAQNYSGKGR